MWGLLTGCWFLSLKNQSVLCLEPWSCDALLLFGQDVCDSKPCLSATICFGHSGQELLNRIGNAVYSAARDKNLQIPSFPDFEPVISALKRGPAQDTSKSYRVSCQQGANLLVLESHAKKWLSYEHTADRTNELLEEHNQEFNSTGNFWLAERTAFSMQFCWAKPLFYCIFLMVVK